MQFTKFEADSRHYLARIRYDISFSLQSIEIPIRGCAPISLDTLNLSPNDLSPLTGSPEHTKNKIDDCPLTRGNNPAQSQGQAEVESPPAPQGTKHDVHKQP